MVVEMGKMDYLPREEGGGDGTSTSHFEWNESSQLFFHSSTGFYYSPTGDWYYSSTDGLYYQFVNGNYLLLDNNTPPVINESEVISCGEGNAGSGHLCNSVASEKDGQFVAEMSTAVIPDSTTSHTADLERLENRQIEEPSPTSEWLEDTLIELFLSNNHPRYPVGSSTCDDVLPTPIECYDLNDVDAAADGESESYKVDEGEGFSEENNNLIVTNGNDTDPVVYLWHFLKVL